MERFDLLEGLGDPLVEFMQGDGVRIDLFCDLVRAWNDLLLHFVQLVGYLILHELLYICKLVLRAICCLWWNEDEGLERVLKAIRLDDLEHQEIELLFLLVEQARTKFFDTLIGHANLSYQKVKENDLHDEYIGYEEEPGDSNDGVLVSAVKVALFLIIAN